MKSSRLFRFIGPARLGAVAGSITLASLLALGFSAGPASAATPPVAPAAVPPALRPALYKALAKDAGPAYSIKKDGCATLPKSKLKACFGAGGVRFAGAQQLALHLTAFGRGTRLASVTAVQPVIKGNQISYRHGNLTAWWRVLPMGFEQGFTIAHRPAGHGDLTLALAMTRHSREGGTAKAERRSEHARSAWPEGRATPVASNPVRTSPLIPLRSKGGKELAWGKLRYGKLAVTDAHGKVIPATLTTQGSRILIAVNDANAAYPLTVDPLVWIQQKVPANDDGFEVRVALDGSIAIVGAPDVTVNGNFDQGTVYVFTDSNGTWTQTGELAPSDAAKNASFGFSVALVGTTAIVGAEGADDGQGAAYVFTYSNGAWTQKAKLVANDGAESGNLGWSAAFDGTTAIVGAPHSVVNGATDEGAAYVFSESDGTWTQTAKLTASDGAAYDSFGYRVAISGTTAIVAPLVHRVNGNPAQGAVYVFDESNGTWTQSQELIASDGDTDDDFGRSVALDGTTALIGASGRSVNGNEGQGAAYVFDESNGAWTQSQELTASDGTGFDQFGNSVSLDGTTAIVGAYTKNGDKGAAYVFSESDGTWTQSQKLTASDSGEFGFSVALNGTTALVGNANAAYFYGQSDLGLDVSAPETVASGANYTAQTIVTNEATAASPAVAITVPIPAAASFVSASATQGSCRNLSASVSCNFGSITGNAGTAKANVTFKAKGTAGTTIENQTAILNATPPLSANAPTTISSSSNHPPVAKNGTLTTDENTAASGTLVATDADGDPLTFSILAQPSHGNVTLDDASTGAYTYTPASGYSGADSFTFKANDGKADSNTATISITVNAAPPPPPPPPPPPHHGGGGGAFGGLGLFALIGLAALIRRRR